MNQYFTIFGHQVYAYGVMVVLAIAVATLTFFMLGTKYAKFIDSIEFLFYAAINAIVSAKIVFFISAIPDIIADPLYLHACLFEGGFNYTAGLVAALITGFVMCKRRDMSLPRVMSAFVISICIGHAILKIGCLYNGCCYGWAHDGAFSMDVPGVGKMFAMPMIESLASLGLFTALFILFMKTSYKEESIVHLYFMVIYPVIKFVLEFFRGDAVRGVYILSVAQWLCIAMFIVGAVMLLPHILKKFKKVSTKVEYVELKKVSKN